MVQGACSPQGATVRSHQNDNFSKCVQNCCGSLFIFPGEDRFPASMHARWKQLWKHLTPAYSSISRHLRLATRTCIVQLKTCDVVVSRAAVQVPPADQVKFIVAAVAVVHTDLRRMLLTFLENMSVESLKYEPCSLLPLLSCRFLMPASAPCQCRATTTVCTVPAHSPERPCACLPAVVNPRRPPTLPPSSRNTLQRVQVHRSHVSRLPPTRVVDRHDAHLR